MYKFLRRFRIVFAILFLIAITLVFADIGGNASSFFKDTIRLQFVPALLGALTGIVGIFISLILITLVFGRIYCSFLCPAGIFQDVVTFIANIFKSRKKRRYTYAKPHRILRYTIMTLVVALLILGSTKLLLDFDPYSNYGRMAENVFRPVIISANNVGASLFPSTFYQLNYKTFTFASIIYSVMFLVIITVMSALRGRLYCNTICPVGSLLGLISKYSVFRIAINKTKCTHCRLCELACKSQCINSKNEQVDSSRCVQCYNCTVSCKHNAIGFQFAYVKKEKQPVDASKRKAFIASAGILGAALVTRIFVPKLRAATKNAKAIAPPGAESIDHLKQYCTACHACIAKCPSRVLRPAFNEYGFDGALLPLMDYKNGYCNYDCVECSNVCPNRALIPKTSEEKKKIQIGKANFIHENCIVILDGTDCGACDEHCPTKAVHMVSFRDGLFIPEVNTDLCVGCGGCEYICPGRPTKAIVVVGNEVHQTVNPPEQQKQEEKTVTDFGF
ncbi:MAG: 4Fe-4S binding protein [Prevotellaceae bacterium]|jgi:ferredoxin|nr:4Fe-4S binding protein [Prevotellaceae bacterium]